MLSGGLLSRGIVKKRSHERLTSDLMSAIHHSPLLVAAAAALSLTSPRAPLNNFPTQILIARHLVQLKLAG